MMIDGRTFDDGAAHEAGTVPLRCGRVRRGEKGIPFQPVCTASGFGVEFDRPRTARKGAVRHKHFIADVINLRVDGVGVGGNAAVIHRPAVIRVKNHAVVDIRASDLVCLAQKDGRVPLPEFRCPAPVQPILAVCAFGDVGRPKRPGFAVFLGIPVFVFHEHVVDFLQGARARFIGGTRYVVPLDGDADIFPVDEVVALAHLITELGRHIIGGEGVELAVRLNDGRVVHVCFGRAGIGLPVPLQTVEFRVFGIRLHDGIVELFYRFFAFSFADGEGDDIVTHIRRGERIRLRRDAVCLRGGSLREGHGAGRYCRAHAAARKGNDELVRRDDGIEGGAFRRVIGEGGGFDNGDGLRFLSLAGGEQNRRRCEHHPHQDAEYFFLHKNYPFDKGGLQSVAALPVHFFVIRKAFRRRRR